METWVYFNDVDLENRLTMKGALRLMQEASNCHSDQVGYGLNQIPQTGYSWVLHQQRCHMYQRPGWGTKLTVRTWSRGAEGLMCLRDFEMRDEQDQLVAVATTAWLLVDAKTQRMLRVPEGMMEEYGTVEEQVFAEPLKRLKVPADAPKTWEYTILRRDMDINRHVNNLCYVDFAMESLPPQVEAADFNDMTVMYKRAAFLGDTITCYGGWQTSDGQMLSEKTGAEDEKATTYVAAIKDAEGSHLHAVVYLEQK